MHWFLIALAVASAVLQIAGYIIYIRKSLKLELEPHPATWFMFAYGTLILGVLEFDQGAHWTLLLLPGICAALAIVVAFICWKKGKLKWPKHQTDQLSFSADIALTICYVGAWVLLAIGLLNEQERVVGTLVFLVCSNLTTITAFYPLLRETSENPHRELSLPWMVWASAYIVLGMATYISSGLWTALMIYPVLNAILHGFVAFLARPSSKVEFERIKRLGIR